MEATAWYLEEGEVELGLRFAEEIDRTLERIAANPLAWTEVKPGIRRALVHGFPYAVLYAVEVAVGSGEVASFDKPGGLTAMGTTGDIGGWSTLSGQV